MVFRELDLVVVVTSHPNVSDERRGYRRALFDLLSEHVPAGGGWDLTRVLHAVTLRRDHGSASPWRIEDPKNRRS
jgi:hypothetical protein